MTPTTELVRMVAGWMRVATRWAGGVMARSSRHTYSWMLDHDDVLEVTNVLAAIVDEAHEEALDYNTHYAEDRRIYIESMEMATRVGNELTNNWRAQIEHDLVHLEERRRRLQVAHLACTAYLKSWAGLTDPAKRRNG